MFDLFRSRDKAVRYLLGALLMLVALSMVITLVPGFGSSSGAQDPVVAEVAGQTITVPEVQRAIQAAARSRSVPPEMMPHYIPQLIEQLITERALAYEARRLGYKISEADIAAAIQGLIPNLFQDGKFVGKDAYAAVLAQQNLSIQDFERDLGRQLLATRLRNVALEGSLVSPQEIEQEFKKRNEKARIEYVKVSPDQFRQQVKVTPEAVRSYFEAHKVSYQIPEKRNLGILLLDQNKLEQSIQPSDADLERMYNRDKDRFRTPERVKVRHILLKTTGLSKEQEAAVKTKAENLLKQVKSGADFAELAKKNSEDTGSASNGGALPDWVVRGQTVPEFEKVAFSLKPGQTSDLVKTQYGYHIIQVLAKEEAHLKPFQEAKAELAADYKKQRVNDLLQSAADKAQAALSKNPQHPEQVAAELNMQYVKAENVAPGQVIEGVGTSRDFDSSIAGLRKGEVSQPVMLPGNKLALAVVLDILPAHPAKLEEVEEQVRTALVNERAEKLASAKVEELYKKAKASGDLAAAAKSLGLALKTSSDFTHQGAVEGLGSAAYVAQAFTDPAGTIFGPISLPDAKAVGKVLAHVPADMSQFASQRDSIRDELKSRQARMRNSLFEDGLRQALTREGKIKIHQDVLNRLVANYRG